MDPEERAILASLDTLVGSDAIRAGKTGSKPLQEHLRKHEAKRKAEAAKGKPTARPTLSPSADLDIGSMAPGRDRARRGTRSSTPAAAQGDATALGGREQRQLNRKRVGQARTCSFAD